MKSRVVIFPTDFSPCAQNAMKYAIEIAKALKCPLRAIHEVDVSGVHSSAMMTSNTLNMVSMLEEQATASLDQVKEQINDLGVKCVSQLLIGKSLHHYIKHIEEDEDPFVVMGTVGSGAIENRLLGSQTSKILNEIAAPILVVPTEASFDGIAEIIFATDYKSSDTKHFKLLTEIGNHFKSNIDAVHVADGKFDEKTELILLSDFEKEITKSVDYLKLNFQLLYANNIEDRLQTMIKEQQVDLLVLVTQKRSFFDRFFDKSLAKKMIYHTHIPMLIFANPKK